MQFLNHLQSTRNERTMLLTDGGNRSYNLSQLQLIQDRRFTSSIKTDHENAHLLLGKQAWKKFGESKPHLGSPLRSSLPLPTPNLRRAHNALRHVPKNTKQEEKQQSTNESDLDQENRSEARRTNGENENHHSRELQTSPDFSAEVTDLYTIAISGSGFPTAEQSGNRKPISAHTKPEKATLQRMQRERAHESWCKTENTETESSQTQRETRRWVFGGREGATGE